jgi:hypothetical protein
MNISELIMNAQQLAPQLAATCCIVNGAFLTLEEVGKMGYDEFSFRSKINMPLKLYKYFPNKEIVEKDGNKVNYSFLALKNNTVYMQSPSLFDDVYDSEINIDYYEYYKYRLIEYCRRSGLVVDDGRTIEEIGTEFLKLIINSYEINNDFKHIFTVNTDSEIERLENEIFENKIIIGLADNQDIGQVVSDIIAQEYQSYVEELKNTFRISCFATTPFSQLMWGGVYADCHNGFCIEYTVLPNDEKYKDIYYNLFPMVYCKTRSNITEELVKWNGKDKTKEYLWDIYFHGTLRKSIDWAFQNEWRLLLPLSERNGDDYNVKFFPITRVYLGNRMQREKRKEIIDFCNANNIPYVGVRRNPDVYEMQECSVKCESCSKFIG